MTLGIFWYYHFAAGYGGNDFNFTQDCCEPFKHQLWKNLTAITWNQSRSSKEFFMREADNVSSSICLVVIPQRKIPARDWSKSRHVTFTNTP